MQRRIVMIAALGTLPGAALTSILRAASFEGNWSATVNCPREPGGARGYTYRFTASVKGGALHGENGRCGTPGSLTITGHVATDGAVSFNAHGIVNNPKYALKHRKMGVKYAYSAIGRFSGRHGNAHRTHGWTCNYSFREALRRR